MVRATRAEGLRTVSPALHNHTITRRPRMQMNLLASPDPCLTFRNALVCGYTKQAGAYPIGDHGNVAIEEYLIFRIVVNGEMRMTV
jgi:hypothetical protein